MHLHPSSLHCGRSSILRAAVSHSVSQPRTRALRLPLTVRPRPLPPHHAAAWAPLPPPLPATNNVRVLPESGVSVPNFVARENNCDECLALAILNSLSLSYLHPDPHLHTHFIPILIAISSSPHQRPAVRRARRRRLPLVRRRPTRRSRSTSTSRARAPRCTRRTSTMSRSCGSARPIFARR
jgi:hypothetical protein